MNRPFYIYRFISFIDKIVVIYHKCYWYSFHCHANKTIRLCPSSATNIIGCEWFENIDDGDLDNDLFISCSANKIFSASKVVPVSEISSEKPGQQFVSCSANKNLVYPW